MILNVVAILLSSITLGLLGFLIIKIRDKDIKETSSSEYLENKLDVVTKDINEIENQLQSVTAPINELNRFLGGNVSTGRLGEWSLESIVSEIMPEGSFNFQHIINPRTQDQVDCAVSTADGLLIPIDSKFYAGLYGNYHEAKTQTDKSKVLRQLKTAILNDADDIANKYILQNTTTDYGILYLASEKLNDLIGQIENLRQDCLSQKRILIQGPNTLAAFLDTVRMGHHYLKLNETAGLVAEVVRKIKDQFKQFDASTEKVLTKLDASVKEVTNMQTRINVLGRELNKGAEQLENTQKEE